MEKLNKDLLIKLALDLDLPDLYSLCRSNKKYSFICDSQTFWNNKLYKDYKIFDKNAKETYQKIKENGEHCQKMLKEKTVDKNSFILESFGDEYFNNYNDFLVFTYITSKLLAKGKGFVNYHKNNFDNWIKKINYLYDDKIFRGNEFTYGEFEVFMSLLEQLKKFPFETSIINGMSRGDIPFDATWGSVCGYLLY